MGFFFKGILSPNGFKEKNGNYHQLLISISFCVHDRLSELFSIMSPNGFKGKKGNYHQQLTFEKKTNSQRWKN